MIILSIREIGGTYAVEGPKWMKMSSLLDELTSAGTSRQAVIILDLLELISSQKDMIQILPLSPSESQDLNDRKERISRYVETHVFDKISLEEVAAYLGMNRTYFCMFFKKHYGKGFADYLNDIRVERASVMLLQGDRQIADIAKECGFKTAPYFTRAFKRSCGMTPGEYRRRHSIKLDK